MKRRSLGHSFLGRLREFVRMFEKDRARTRGFEWPFIFAFELIWKQDIWRWLAYKWGKGHFKPFMFCRARSFVFIFQDV